MKFYVIIFYIFLHFLHFICGGFNTKNTRLVCRGFARVCLAVLERHIGCYFWLEIQFTHSRAFDLGELFSS